MASAANPSNRVYDDFGPTLEWAKEDVADTLLLFLPGFRKEQIKVQITSTGNLRVTGERQVGDNRWSRFRQEMPIRPTYDTNKISAKFENGILFVKHPKMTTLVPVEPPRKEARPAAESSQPPKATTPAAPKEQKQKATMEPPKPQKSPLKKPEDDEKPKENRPEVKEAANGVKLRNERENAGTAADEKKMKDANAADRKKPDVGDLAEASLPQKAETSTARDKKPDGPGDGARKKEELAPLYSRLHQAPKPTNYKQAIGDLVVNLKKPRNLITTVAAVLLVVFLGLSVKTAIKSFRQPQSSRPENTEL